MPGARISVIACREGGGRGGGGGVLDVSYPLAVGEGGEHFNNIWVIISVRLIIHLIKMPFFPSDNFPTKSDILKREMFVETFINFTTFLSAETLINNKFVPVLAPSNFQYYCKQLNFQKSCLGNKKCERIVLILARSFYKSG